MTKEKAQALIDKYLAGTCSAEEKQLVESWYNKWASSQKRMSGEPDYGNIQRMTYERLPLKGRMHRTAWIRVAAAAIVLLAVAGALYFYMSTIPHTETAMASVSAVMPGSNKAILTLADGQKINLTDADSGEVAGQVGSRIVKQADGQLTYLDATEHRGHGERYANPVSYHTLKVPKGGQYRIQLSDGTKVWLNAASSLRYPSTFTGTERVVELTGEAYFEVAKAASSSSKGGKTPFRVIANGQEVTVLGTHFNVHAYADEQATKTTLLEGKVRVSSMTKDISCLLQPGEEALFQDNRLQVGHADIEQATAWKNGYFLFRRVNIQSVMRQISRWYDIDVRYEGAVPQDEFVGKIPRNAPIEQVIRVLQLSNVHCRLENKKLIITHSIL